MPVLLVYNHGRKAKPIGRVISVEMINGQLVLVWRKKTDTIKKAIKNTLLIVFLYICFAFLFNLWPVSYFMR